MSLDYSKYPKSVSCGVNPGYFSKFFDYYKGKLDGRLVIHFNEYPVIDNTILYKNTDEPWLIQLQIKAAGNSHGSIIIAPLVNGQRVGYLLNFFDIPIEGQLMLQPLLGFVLQMPIIAYNIQTPVIENIKCHKSGYCLAFAMLYTQGYLGKQEVDLKQILNFLGFLEKEFSVAPEELDYGWFDQPQNVGLVSGAVIGGGVGALAGGWPGALIGAGAGGLIGYGVGGGFSR